MTQHCLAAIPSLDRDLADARRVLIACDFDGTLCPIAQSPAHVHVPPSVLDALRLISASDRITLAIISGRELQDVSKRLPVDAIFAGNHGLEIRGAGLRFDHPCARRLRPKLKRQCEQLRELVKRWPGAWVEDKGLSATVHYRAVEDTQHHAVLCAVRRYAVRRDSPFGVRAGRKALEIYPRIGWDKGAALNHIRAKAGPFDLCICLGDDQTDENMFHHAPDQINIRVGRGRPTKARFHLDDTSEVATFLRHVADVRRASNHFRSPAPIPAISVAVL